jgi:uncharacterized protein YeaO (DUF488 family)
MLPASRSFNRQASRSSSRAAGRRCREWPRGGRTRGQKAKSAHKRELGAPREIRDKLKETGDYAEYFRRFNVYLRTQRAALEGLVEECVGAVVLMCFERDPSECHRSAVARELGKLADLKPVHLDVEERRGSVREEAGLRTRQGAAPA